MNVGELRKLLEQFPDDMEVVVEFHSDYCEVTDLARVMAVQKNGWLMRHHRTMDVSTHGPPVQVLLVT